MQQEFDIEKSIARMVQFNTAASSELQPAHGATLLARLTGELQALQRMNDDDAMIFAIHVQDAMPRIRRMQYELDTWTKNVSTMGPDAVPDHGARLK